MVKKIALLFVCFLVIVGFFAFYANNDPGSSLIKLSKYPEAGQRDLVYRVHLFGIFPVAEAVFNAPRIKVLEGKSVYHVQGQAGIMPFLTKFLNASATLDSYIEVETLNPILFIQKVNIPGNAGGQKEVRYDQKNKVMTIAGVKRVILENTQDPISLFMNIRQMDLTRVGNISMVLNNNQKNYAFEASIMPKDLKAGGKIYKTSNLEARIFRRDKNPYHKSQVSILLLTREKANIPLVIKVFANGMFVSFKLVDVR